MRTKKLRAVAAAILLAIAFVGCQDLAVENPNEPDKERAIRTAEDVQSLISGSFLTWWTGTQKDISFPALTLSVIADAHTSSWGNWAMWDMSTEPRMPWNNSVAYTHAAVNRETWYAMYRAISSVNDGLIAINKGLKIIEGGVDQTVRARAFAKFVQGLAHGWLALFFDKAFIYDETIDINTVKLELKPYREVMTAALKMLEDCIAITRTGTFRTPRAWINGVELTEVELRELAYSYMARFRAAVARTPAERAAVDWAKVISDARNGIKRDFAPIGDGNLWWDALKFRGQHPIWTRVDYRTIGISDKSGRYEAWLRTPVAMRNVFDVESDDRRIHGPGGPRTPGKDMRWWPTSPFRDDRGTYHHSLYSHTRYRYHLDGGATGPMPAFLVAELDLTIAEGLWRTGGSAAEIVALINRTRVGRGEMPPLVATMSRDEIFKWLKYEKMIETFATASGLPWFDRRGWGDLVPGTLLHFPIPGKELEILRMEIYTFGGVGGPGAAPKRAMDYWLPLRQVSPQ